VILAAVAVAVTLIYTKIILIPFVFAIFLYETASPLQKKLQNRFKCPSTLALVLTIGFFTSALLGLGFLVVTSVQEFISGAQDYRARVILLSQEAIHFLISKGLEIDDTTLIKELTNLPVFSVARDITGAVAAFVGNIVLTLVFFMFIITGDSVTSAEPPEILLEINQKTSSYVVAKLVTSLISAVLVWIVLLIFGTELAFMFGLLAFLLNFIPNIGGVLVTVLPIPVLLMEFGLAWKFPVAVGIIGLTQIFIGSFLEPRYLGESMDLHPAAVLIFLMFWGLIWGVPGMFLAVPITAILKIILSKIEATKPLAELLAGRIENPRPAESN